MKSNPIDKIEKGLNESIISDRHQMPGGSWLYIKIYCGFKIADQILSNKIYPVCKKFLSKMEIDKFFFIRYNDPEHHIRLRVFKSLNPNFWEFIGELNYELKELIENRLVIKVQLDTYHREIERYGVNNIDNTETLFYINSNSVLDYIRNGMDTKHSQRWKVAIKSVDMFLNDFDLKIEQKINFVKMRRENYFLHYGYSSEQRKAFSNKYHSSKKLIEAILNDDSLEENNQNIDIRFFRIQTEQYSNLIQRVIENCQTNGNSSLYDWLGSYIHMFINRLFITDQVAHEIIIYDYLFRYYESLIARNKLKQNMTN